MQTRIASTELSTSPLGADEQQKLSAALRQQLEQSLSKEFIGIVESKYGRNIRDDLILKEVKLHFEATEHRLQEEIDSLSRRGNINLIIGTLTTLIAVGILVSSILTYVLPTDPKGLAAHLLPRITLSIFIEIFSFFFLRLYNSGLNDIKYYQNELTNVEFKSMALQRAFQIQDQGPLTEILKDLAGTERNFVLKKGETTVELEKSKLNQNSLREQFDAMIGAVKLKQ